MPPTEESTGRPEVDKRGAQGTAGLDYPIWPGLPPGLASSLSDLLRRLPGVPPAQLPDAGSPAWGACGRRPAALLRAAAPPARARPATAPPPPPRPAPPPPPPGPPPPARCPRRGAS